MSAQHTPGPWAVDGEDMAIEGFPYVLVSAGKRGTKEFSEIAEVCGKFDGKNAPLDKAAWANARLIAAAPDLLALAYQYHKDLLHPPTDESPLIRFIAINAAIAKATQP